MNGHEKHFFPPDDKAAYVFYEGIPLDLSHAYRAHWCVLVANEANEDDVGSMLQGKQSPELQVRCPRTNGLIGIGLAIKYPDIKRIWGRPVQIECPHCERVHEFDVLEALVGQALLIDGR